MLIVGFICILIPRDILLNFMFLEKFKKKQENFQDISHLFNEYKALNPLQRIHNLNLFIAGSKNRIDIQVYKDAIYFFVFLH